MATQTELHNMFIWHKCKVEWFYLPCGEYILKLIGTEEMPLFIPVTLSVSTSISWRTSSKSVNFFPLQCRNSAYSAKNINNNSISQAYWLEHPLSSPQCSSDVWAQKFIIMAMRKALLWLHIWKPALNKKGSVIKSSWLDDLLLLSLAHHLLEQRERFN